VREDTKIVRSSRECLSVIALGGPKVETDEG